VKVVVLGRINKKTYTKLCVEIWKALPPHIPAARLRLATRTHSDDLANEPRCVQVITPLNISPFEHALQPTVALQDCIKSRVHYFVS
jgi:hypothetical protein